MQNEVDNEPMTRIGWGNLTFEVRALSLRKAALIALELATDTVFTEKGYEVIDLNEPVGVPLVDLDVLESDGLISYVVEIQRTGYRQMQGYDQDGDPQWGSEYHAEYEVISVQPL